MEEMEKMEKMEEMEAADSYFDGFCQRTIAFLEACKIVAKEAAVAGAEPLRGPLDAAITDLLRYKDAATLVFGWETSKNEDGLDTTSGYIQLVEPNDENEDENEDENKDEGERVYKTFYISEVKSTAFLASHPPKKEMRIFKKTFEDFFITSFRLSPIGPGSFTITVSDLMKDTD